MDEQRKSERQCGPNHGCWREGRDVAPKSDDCHHACKQGTPRSSLCPTDRSAAQHAHSHNYRDGTHTSASEAEPQILAGPLLQLQQLEPSVSEDVKKGS